MWDPERQQKMQNMSHASDLYLNSTLYSTDCDERETKDSLMQKEFNSAIEQL